MKKLKTVFQIFFFFWWGKPSDFFKYIIEKLLSYLAETDENKIAFFMMIFSKILTYICYYIHSNKT